MTMADAKPKRPAALVRPFVLALVVGVIAYFTWRGCTRREGYSGGNISTTGTIEAVHVQLSFKVAGRIMDVAVVEGAQVRPGDLVARLETQDLDVAVSTSQAAIEAARAGLAEAHANRQRAARDLARQRALMKSDATTAQQVDDARAGAQVAEAQVRARQAQLHQAESELRQAELFTPEAGPPERGPHVAHHRVEW